MRTTLLCRLAGVAAVAMLSAAAWADGIPRAVSPGSDREVLVIGGRCPTFSWVAPAGAESVELVVYRLPDEEPAGGGLDGSPVIQQLLPGAARSWTPELDRCLEPGAGYAWSLRWAARGGPSAWSTPSLFRIGGAAAGEVEEALEVLRAYIARHGEVSVARALVERALGAGTVEAASVAEAAAAAARGGAEKGAPAPRLPLGFKAGLVAEEGDTASPTVGVQGVSHSALEGSSGVWGESWPLDGKVAGVKGTVLSYQGWGGYFQNYGYLGAGVFASGGPPVGSPPALSADLVLGGVTDIFGALDDSGTIFSDQRYPSSGLFLFSNDDIRLHLDLDADLEDARFQILGPGTPFTTLFSVNDDGNTVVSGDLTVAGTPGGSLQSASDVAVAVANALDQHETDFHPKLIFVTSTTHTGNLGGLDGAHTICRQRAAAAGLSGIFKAWVSGWTESQEAQDWLVPPYPDVPYLLPDGTKVADNWNDLTDGSLGNAITKDEFGVTVTTNMTAYTNTNSDGSMHENSRACRPSGGSAWTGAGTVDSGRFGTVGSTTGTWTSQDNHNCTHSRRLYCVQK